MRGYFSLVLHTHMPYVRKNGAWPVGEDWLFQVMSDTYLPLLGTLSQLDHEGLSGCMAITLTPVLCEQLADDYIRERFVAYLKTMADRATADIRDFEYFDDAERKALAESYHEEYRRKLLAYTSIDGDILGAIASLESRGLIETVASCATHAFLPGQEDPRAVKRQVLLGLESHRRHMGGDPAGFWIPECAYRGGLEGMLEEQGIRYILADPSSLGGLSPNCPYLVGDSKVAVLSRSERAHLNVWDEDAGYPTDDRYRDSTKYYHGSGLYYWRVTGNKVAIEDKAVYGPRPALSRALDHARHFIDEVTGEINCARPCLGGARPMVLASYDTEFFGRGWYEGIYWLEVTLRSLAGSDTVRVTVPSRYLEENPPVGPARLSETSWGTNRDHSTWINDSTGWMWDELRGAQAELFALASRCAGEGDPGTARALRQAAREVLILESSDWPYMVAKDRAGKYATQRFETHLERFHRIEKALGEGDIKLITAELPEIEETDNIFGELDLGVISGEGDPRGT